MVPFNDQTNAAKGMTVAIKLRFDEKFFQLVTSFNGTKTEKQVKDPGYK